MEGNSLHFAIIALCTIFISSLPATNYCCASPQEKPQPLNIIMLIDQGAGSESKKAEQGKYESMASRLHDAIIQCAHDNHTIIVTSPALLHCLAIINTIKPENGDFQRIAASWNTYLSYLQFTRSKTLAVLIPKTFSGTMVVPSNRSDIIERIAPEHVFETFVDKTCYSTPYFTETLRTILEAFGHNTPKRIYLAGHGFEKFTVANITFNHYQNTLQVFNDCNVEFVYLASCFAGGKNLLLMHRLIEDPFRSPNLPPSTFFLDDMHFTIAVGTVTDAEQFEENTPEYFCRFFEAVDQFIATKESIKGRASTALAQALYNLMPYRNNIPLVRLPHDSEGPQFRAISFNNAYVLSSRKYLAIKNIQRPAAPLCSPNKAKDSLLVYPISLDGIIINPAATPLFISMIPGTAQHYIQHLKSNTTVPQTIQKLLCSPLTQDGRICYFSQCAKAWFVEKLVAPTETITGLVVHKQATSNTRHDSFTVLFKSNNRHYRYTIEGLLSLDQGTEITLASYQEAVRQIHDATRADPKAIAFATEQHEDSNSEDVAFQHFREACAPERYQTSAAAPRRTNSAKTIPAPTIRQQHYQFLQQSAVTKPTQPQPARKEQLAQASVIHYFGSHKNPNGTS